MINYSDLLLLVLTIPLQVNSSRHVDYSSGGNQWFGLNYSTVTLKPHISPVPALAKLFELESITDCDICRNIWTNVEIQA